MKSEDLKNHSESLRNLIITLAILIGGIWTLYTFDSKLEVENASARLTKLKRELAEKPLVSAKIKSEVIYTQKNNKFYIRSTIVLTNRGSKDSRIFLGKDAFRIAKINYDMGVIKNFESPTYSGFYEIPHIGSKEPYSEFSSITLLAGHEKSYVTSFELDQPGMYKIEFYATPGPEIRVARKTTKAEDQNSQWVAASDIVYVEAH